MLQTSFVVYSITIPSNVPRGLRARIYTHAMMPRFFNQVPAGAEHRPGSRLHTSVSPSRTRRVTIDVRAHGCSAYTLPRDAHCPPNSAKTSPRVLRRAVSRIETCTAPSYKLPGCGSRMHGRLRGGGSCTPRSPGLVPHARRRREKRCIRYNRPGILRYMQGGVYEATTRQSPRWMRERRARGEGIGSGTMAAKHTARMAHGTFARDRAGDIYAH